MIDLLLGGLSLACLALAAVLLRRVGPGYRVARLLAATPRRSLAQAIDLARSGVTVYVRLTGRISSDEEFPDEHDRPLVYRRSRVEIANERGRWQTVSRDSEAVPFGIELRGEYVAVESADLAEGLVVVPREALGVAADLAAELVAGHPPGTPSRLVIEQVSAVEQATVVGVPVLSVSEGGGEAPTVRAGLGRPLILTTLDEPAAMRLLAAGRRRLVLAATAAIAAALVLALAAVVAFLALG
ncbi:MAG TPA: hypothetical protein VMP67_11450 [Candidatus Limnocylindria bacterium]|nr:hypothetical protein [Candidatus Limnocylindria bacterium]